MGSFTLTPGEEGPNDGLPPQKNAQTHSRGHGALTSAPLPAFTPPHAPPQLLGWLTLISAGVILRLVGRCLTVAALESASAMSGLSVGSVAAARISSSFSAQPREAPSQRPAP